VLRAQLEAAFDSAYALGPEVFYEDGRTIRYVDRFREVVLSSLDAQGVCGVFDFGNGMGDEIYLRSPDGTISEVWDAVASSGTPRLGYLTTCEPPLSFPEPPPTLPDLDPTCSLPPSQATFCLDSSFQSLYYGVVHGAIEEVAAERPELFNFDDTEGGELSWALTDEEAYVAAVVEKLHEAGYCVLAGEELAVKADNSVNENFDIVRNPPGGGAYSRISYRGKCHNALF